MIKRELYLNQIRNLFGTDFIKVIVGLRRCGKTSLLKSIIEELQNQGIKKENIIYISFELVEYKNIFTSEQLDETVLNLTSNIEGKIYLLFDEIQQVESWEKSINSYRASFDCDIYITGSNSKLLSNELATLLAGRYIKISLYPFSFKEVLQYRREIDKIKLDGEFIKKQFNEYLLFGGMPGLLAIRDDDTKINALQDIYDSIIVHDILSRYTINEIDLFKRFSHYLMNSTGQTFSKTSITNYLKSENKRTTRNTISNFTDYLKDSLFCKMVRRQDILGKKILKTEEKYYLTDQGFHHALVDNNNNWLGRILENVVFNELVRRGYSVKIGKIRNKEIDFVCEKHDNKIYVQVAYILSSSETIEREFSPLMDVPDKYDAYVLSMDEFDMSRDGIKHKNIIDFLLDDEI
ncbi:MAG: ATP-binding protein [Methanobrevibacter sp.]|jgi:predicted AAA+ superfamily ATPase|uniref:ATP-binding protein n=1 Tax=Methanobrevibacter sp. TaxID=66852 RepID=UPI001E10B56E|nr:ATP-binding protein [Methanobrevibacter sp.]MBE6489613.1 ATP-binding protein [Methanobrevibacter sp.]MBE6497248.1 ATP-binding protein [Methanobrevibacter sp.]